MKKNIHFNHLFKYFIYVFRMHFLPFLLFTLHTNIHAQISLEGASWWRNNSLVLGDTNTCVVFLIAIHWSQTSTLSLSFKLLCDREQPVVERGFSPSTMMHWFTPNSAKSCLQQRLRFVSYLEKYVTNCAGVYVFVKDVAIIYDKHINVQEIFCEILTHTFVPAFSGTHGRPI